MIIARQSEVKRFKRCPRSEWLGYRHSGRGLRLQVSEVGIRDLGTLVHAGVAGYYTHGDALAPVQEERARLVAAEAWTPEWESALQYAEIMLDGYVQWVAEWGVDVGETTVCVEERLELPFGFYHGEEVVVTGKLDRVVTDDLTGEYILEDTKTTQTLEPPPLQVDDQLLTYCLLAREAGMPITRVRHNMLRKVKRGPRAVPPFYARVEVPVNEEQYDAHELHLESTMDALVSSIVRREAGDSHHLTNPPNPTRDCKWDCDFLPVCPMLDDGSDWEGMLNAMYEPRPEEDDK